MAALTGSLVAKPACAHAMAADLDSIFYVLWVTKEMPVSWHLRDMAAVVAAESDAKELDRQRILLCITKAEINTIQRETCGRLFQTVGLPTVAEVVTHVIV